MVPAMNDVAPINPIVLSTVTDVLFLASVTSKGRLFVLSNDFVPLSIFVFFFSRIFMSSFKEITLRNNNNNAYRSAVYTL